MAGSPIPVKSIKEDSTITVEIPASLYYRLQNLLLAGIPFENIESARKVLADVINTKSDPDAVTYHTRTLLSLISIIEEAADKQDKTEIKYIDRTTGKLVSAD